jgi:phosphoribosylamine-glycine ligase
MRVLLIGSGGREHALAWKLTREEPDLELIAAPGNPGIAELGECVAVNALDLDGLERIARERAVDLTVVGPEAPLEAGIVDRFRTAGLPIFGPTRAAAEIETSKAFAKQLLKDEGIPTARAEIHTTVAGAKAAARRFGAPVVVKAYSAFCETLGRGFIHHVPGDPSHSDAANVEGYRELLKLYEQVFSESPPADVWPAIGAASARFGNCDSAMGHPSVG